MAVKAKDDALCVLNVEHEVGFFFSHLRKAENRKLAQVFVAQAIHSLGKLSSQTRLN